ncbi:hypothetical protein PVAG01_06857 [Phlyctema vagabunda]|uniref:GAG-pre-integrase domain-containing protein n=1 Tax=Phlyctema vagabunda TaxID=108571 RepID=A0ABR4PH92_9HELO
MSSPQKLALESSDPPKTKSDSQWLLHMGYRGGIEEFRDIFGFGPDQIDDARQLIEELRAEQQAEWEAMHQDNSASSASSDASTTTDALDPAKQELVQQAMLWHRRMGHTNYHSVLALPRAAGDVPRFGNLELRDLPACEFCKTFGTDPFDPESV